VTTLDDIAQILSAAVVVEPALLRTARRRFFPKSGPELEADFIRSPYVTRWNHRVIHLDAEKREQLRCALREKRETASAAVRFLRECHADTFETVKMAEAALGDWLLGKPPEIAANRFRLAIASLGGEHGETIARAAVQDIALLPEDLQDDPTIAELGITAALMLGKSLETDFDRFDEPPVPVRELPKRAIRIALSEGKLFLSTGNLGNAPMIAVPDTRQIPLQIMSDQYLSSTVVTLRAGATLTTELPSPIIAVTSIAGDRWILTDNAAMEGWEKEAMIESESESTNDTETSQLDTIFVSHHMDDEKFAEELRSYLESAGFRCHVENEKTRVVKEWREFTHHVHRVSDHGLLLVSREWAASGWCKEAAKAMKSLFDIQGYPVTLVRLDHTEVPGSLLGMPLLDMSVDSSVFEEQIAQLIGLLRLNCHAIGIDNLGVLQSLESGTPFRMPDGDMMEKNLLTLLRLRIIAWLPGRGDRDLKRVSKSPSGLPKRFRLTEKGRRYLSFIDNVGWTPGRIESKLRRKRAPKK
jgi:hypothetical protein